MDRLHEMEVFVAVAEVASFAKAGRRLRLSPPAVTRAVASLEGRLGARLFNRTTRSLALTEAGARFLASAQHLLAELAAAEREAVGESGAPRGRLTLSASVTLGRIALAPVVRSFLAANAEIAATVLLLDRVVDLVGEGVDVALRVGSLPDSSLVAHRVGRVRRILVAGPGYLAQKGRPETPSALKEHTILAFTGLMPDGVWRHVDGPASGQVALRPRLEINDATAAIAAAEADEGVAPALSYMVASQLREGRLVQVLDRYTPSSVPVQLVYPEGRLVAPKVRAFVDFAAPRLRQALDALALPTATE